MERKIVLFVGAPACGKGTRIEKLKEKGYISLSVSSLLREAGYDVTKGILVEDEDVIKVVIPAIKRTEGNIILDGFPRTVPQANAIIESKIKISSVFYVKASKELVIARSTDRLTCSKCRASFTKSNFKPPKKSGICDLCGGELVQRKDDTKEVVLKRLKDFEEQTNPILEILKENNIPIIDIDASLPPEEVLNYI